MIVIEPLQQVGKFYYPSSELLPVRQHQAYEDVLKKQKELANEIYITRIKERFL